MRRWNIRFFLSPSSLPTFHFTFTFYFIPRRHFFLPTFFPSRQDKEKRYWTFRFRWRQLYFYSIRFIRLNMTCGYRLGNIFSILRVDIPTSSPASLLYSLHVSLLPAACLFAIHFGKIRTILLGIVPASGEFVAWYRSKLSRTIYLGMFLFYL